MSVSQAALPLCIFGFLSEIFSWTPLLNDYLGTSEGIWRHLETINSFTRYSDLVVIVLILLVTDLLRYKTVLILKAASAIVLFGLIHWTNSLGAAEFSIVVHAFYVCCEVAYISYMFDKVSNEHFLTVSTLTRSALLLGRLVSALLVVILVRNVTFAVYTYLALAAQIAALLVAVFLLNFKRSTQQSPNFSLQSTSHDMFKQLQCAISNRRVILYSVWYIFGMGVFYQFITAEEITISYFHQFMREETWNGFFLAIAMALTIFFVLLSPRIKFIHHERFYLIFLAMMSLSSSVLIFLGTNIGIDDRFTSRFFTYICHWISCILYYFTITISSAEIAKGILSGSYGLIFGINTFLAICVRVIIMKLSEFLNISPVGHLNFMGGIMASVGFAYLLFALLFTRSSRPGVVLSRS